MADSYTENFNLVLPEVGGSSDTWGEKLNNNFSELDEVLGQMQQDGENNAPFRVPQGGIILWSGAVNAIPSGWALCDGNNGTPNLRNRFIVGAGGDYAVGDTGGAANVTLTKAQMPAHNHGGSTGDTAPATNSAGSHNHSGTASSAEAHSHTIQGRPITSGSSRTFSLGNPTTAGTGSWVNIVNARTVSAGAHTHSLSINSNGAHTHTVDSHSHSISSQGGGESHENRPPYYALAYIMKL